MAGPGAADSMLKCQTHAVSAVDRNCPEIDRRKFECRSQAPRSWNVEEGSPEDVRAEEM